MADEKKSIIEEALAEFNLIEETLNSNAKEILRSVARDEITSTLNESLNEDEYDIEDIEDVDSDVDALPVDDTADDTFDFEGGDEGGSEELELDDIEMDTADEDLGLGAEEGSEDYGLDMTGASDEDVISVYKKLSGDDEIEIVSSEEVIIKDPVSGSEYNVKLKGSGGSLIDQGEMDVEGDFEPEADMGIETDTDSEIEVDLDSEIGDEMDVDSEMDVEADADTEIGDEMEVDFDDSDDEEGDVEDEDEDDLGESIVYEIELSDDDEDDIVEDIIRGKGHDKELVNTPAPNTGDIEGQKAPEDSDSGDNLVGGFDDDGQNGSGDNHAQHIMEEEDEDCIEEEETLEEDEEVIDEHIPKGRGEAHRMPARADIGQPIGAGAKGVSTVKGGKNESVTSKKLVEAVNRYNALLAEAKQIKAENSQFKSTLKDFRKTITETAVFNINLTHATKLFLEHSTTNEEKKDILTRFDEEVSTIEESKKLYRKINSELSKKTPIKETFTNKLVSEKTTSQSTQLNETTAYVDPAQKRVLDLINRTR